MPHMDWYGKPCSECKSPCSLDMGMPCSPNCGNLLPGGGRKRKYCRKIECDAILLNLAQPRMKLKRKAGTVARIGKLAQPAKKDVAKA